MKLRQIILSVVAAVTMVLAPVPVLVGTAVAANCGNTPAAKQVLGGLGEDQVGHDCGESKVNRLFANIVNLMSIIVGVTSVIVIIYAGFKYMTSGGEQGRVANAKSTLLYAVIGLAVAALAQLMIHFVLAQTSDAALTTPNCPADHHIKPPDCH